MPIAYSVTELWWFEFPLPPIFVAIFSTVNSH